MSASLLRFTRPGVPQGSAIAPDTRGWNFWQADPALQDVLACYLDADLLATITPHLDRLGALAANELDDCATLADRHPPVLQHRDHYGQDSQWIDYHPAYRRMEEIAFGEFGIHAMSHRGGLAGSDQPLPALAKHAFTYLFNQAEFGLGCPINVTDSGAHILRLFGSEELNARFFERMTSTDMERLWQGGQFMTEKEGGSDVGALETVARRDGDAWRLSGEKWFCSNADAEVIMTLARPEGAGPGTRGLGLFLMPRHLEDGSANSYRLIRLKDKLGTRSMASGEARLDGALAYQVGDLERGFVQMAEMVNWSRLSNGVKSAALMRRATHDANAVMQGRVVFGTPLTEKPLARRQMMKMLLPTEEALSLFAFTADALEQAEGREGRPASQAAAAVLRLATPVLKFRATRDGRRVTGDALEMRGGCGYIEEWRVPRLVRDAHLGSVWEGAGNIVALDAVGRAVGRHHAEEAYAAALRQKLQEAEDVPERFRSRLGDHLSRSLDLLTATAGDPAQEARARSATSALYHVSAAILMAWEGAMTWARRGDARRLAMARMVETHELLPIDPLSPPDTALSDSAGRLFLGEAPVSLDEVAEIL